MHRRVAFSGKKKKQQLKEKNKRKAEKYARETSDAPPDDTKVLREQLPNPNGRCFRNPRLYEMESRADLEKRKQEAFLPLDMSKQSTGPVISEEFSFEPIPFPTRPEWNYAMTAEEVQKNEQEYFNKWLEDIKAKYDDENLNYFESNLETWRQLWRVCERSDVLVQVIDVRCPLLHFRRDFADYVIKTLGKQILLVLTKADLIPADAVDAWVSYFAEKEQVRAIPCSAYSVFADEANGEWKMRETLKVRRGMRAKYASASGIKAVRDAIDAISGGESITVGFIGSPNAGKSSLINALCGSHVVSESKTPGHTKHFQTIKLSQEITLCDCPGLVFPLAGAPKGLQVIAGCYPIAHLREPHEAMRYAAERVPLHVLCGTADATTPVEVGGTRDARSVLQDVVKGRVPLYWTPPGWTSTKTEDAEDVSEKENDEENDKKDEEKLCDAETNNAKEESKGDEPKSICEELKKEEEDGNTKENKNVDEETIKQATTNDV